MADKPSIEKMEDRLRLFRANADQARHEAAGLVDFRVRDSFLSIASSWDRLADDVEEVVADLKNRGDKNDHISN